jgi:hypothetical protein
MNDELFGGLRDFITTPNGDLKIVKEEIGEVQGIEWFTQEVSKILKSQTDWYFAPNAGAALDRFHGQVNSRATAGMIQDLLTSKIERQGINFPAELEVKVVPLSRDEIKVYINLKYGYQTINVSKVIFDLEGGFLRDTETIEQQQDMRTPNKHPYATKFV